MLSQDGLPCTDPAQYCPVLEKKGINGLQPVVVYDGGNGEAAALAWWRLKVQGCMPLVLEGGGLEGGGLAAWEAAGNATELYEPCPLKVGH